MTRKVYQKDQKELCTTLSHIYHSPTAVGYYRFTSDGNFDQEANILQMFPALVPGTVWGVGVISHRIVYRRMRRQTRSGQRIREQIRFHGAATVCWPMKLHRSPAWLRRPANSFVTLWVKRGKRLIRRRHVRSDSFWNKGVTLWCIWWQIHKLDHGVYKTFCPR